MTPIKTFRPRWLDRCIYRRRPFFRNMAWGIAILLAAIALWFSVTQHQMYHEAAQRISAAEVDRDLLMAILKGERPAMTEDGEQIARITWEKVELIGEHHE